MEYQYYVDQVQNQNSGGSSPQEIAPIEVPALTSIAATETKVEETTVDSLAQSAVEEVIESPVPEAQASAPLETESQTSVKDDQEKLQSFLASPPWTDPGPKERALPLADAFTRRQHYVESLLTCCAAGRQCALDGDPLAYLRFRAKNESIVCELTNARARFEGRVGRLNMPLSHKLDLVMHRLATTIILWFVGGFIFSYCLILFLSIMRVSLK